MKFSAIFQSGGEVEFELKNSFFLLISQIIESIPFNIDLGIIWFSLSRSLSSPSSDRTGFR